MFGAVGPATLCVPTAHGAVAAQPDGSANTTGKRNPGSTDHGQELPSAHGVAASISGFASDASEQAENSDRLQPGSRTGGRGRSGRRAERNWV